MFEFLDARAATEAGADLGAYAREFLVARAPARARPRPRRTAALFERAADAARALKLNFYKKARLAHAFKWTLLEGGADEATATYWTHELLLHLEPPATAGREAGPPAASGAAAADRLRAVGGDHISAGRFDEAAACYRRIVTLCPGDPGAHNNLGAVCFELGRLAEAEESFRTAARLDRSCAAAHANLGNLYRETGRPDDARRALVKALRIKPGCPDALSSLAATLSVLGEWDRAETQYREALRCNADHVGALVGLGHALALNGDFAQAERLYHRAQELSPQDPSPWAALVGLRRMTAADSGWLRAAERMAEGSLSPVAEANLRFAIGKYHDDAGDFDKAFASYRRANELRRALSVSYDGRATAAHAAAVMECYSANRISSAVAGGSDSERPVFVVGMLRSGTSLIEQIIASHPRAAGAGELRFWSDAAEDVEALGLEQVSATGRGRKLAEQYLRCLGGAAPQSRRVVDKAPGNFMHVGLIHSVFPRARIIHATRNPLDTCLSIYFQNFSTAFGYTSSLADLADFHGIYERVMTHWRSVLPAGVMLDVPYEDLVNDPRTWSPRILEFIGLDWDDRCLDFHETQRRVGTASYWQVRQRPYRTSVARWRNYEKHLGPLRALAPRSGLGQEADDPTRGGWAR